MLNIKTNHTKNFIPHKIAKGTTAERLQKARLFNLKFYDRLQDVIINNEIAPRTFTRTLNGVVGSKIQAEVLDSNLPKDGLLRYCLDMNAKSKGYVLSLPLTFFNKKIHKNNALTFLKVTQSLYNEALNPKFFQRFTTMLRKGYKVDNAVNFYEKNISGTNRLTTENLDNFLNGKRAEEQINTLQFLRYKLLSEKNTAQAMKQIEKRIEMHNGLKYERSADYFNLDKYAFDEKFSILESKLSKLLELEREQIKRG